MAEVTRPVSVAAATRQAETRGEPRRLTDRPAGRQLAPPR